MSVCIAQGGRALEYVPLLPFQEVSNDHDLGQGLVNIYKALAIYLMQFHLMFLRTHMTSYQLIAIKRNMATLLYQAMDLPKDGHDELQDYFGMGSLKFQVQESTGPQSNVSCDAAPF